jgi:hypothetical protein
MISPNYKRPVGPEPIYDLALQALIAQVVSNITGIAIDLCRPRYQPNPPLRPEPTVNWVAVSDTTTEPDAGPVIESINPDPGQLQETDHEHVTFLASFYGPNGQSNANRLKMGIYLATNREDLTAIDMNLVDVGTVTRASELIKQQFNQRYDLEFSFNRKIVRVYDVPRFSGADIHLFDDTSFDETVPVPPPQPNT